MRGLFLLPTVYRLNASELAATRVETSLQLRTIIRSTPTETQSMSENDFECFASTGENTPEIMFPNLWMPVKSALPQRPDFAPTVRAADVAAHNRCACRNKRRLS
jgi:hypothetical protein